MTTTTQKKKNNLNTKENNKNQKWRIIIRIYWIELRIWRKSVIISKIVEFIWIFFGRYIRLYAIYVVHRAHLHMWAYNVVHVNENVRMRKEKERSESFEAILDQRKCLAVVLLALFTSARARSYIIFSQWILLLIYSSSCTCKVHTVKLPTTPTTTIITKCQSKEPKSQQRARARASLIKSTKSFSLSPSRLSHSHTIEKKKLKSLQ